MSEDGVGATGIGESAGEVFVIVGCGVGLSLSPVGVDGEISASVGLCVGLPLAPRGTDGEIVGLPLSVLDVDGELVELPLGVRSVGPGVGLALGAVGVDGE